MAPHGKGLSEDLRIRIVALHKDGLGYEKFGNSLELSYSTVARVIQRFSKMVFTRNRPRKGRSKKLSPCAVRQVQKLASKNRRMSAASIALEVAEVEGQLVSAQTIRHTRQTCLSLRQTCLAQMVSSMCGDTLVRSTKKIVPDGGSMVVVASWSGAA